MYIMPGKSLKHLKDIVIKYKLSILGKACRLFFPKWAVKSEMTIQINDFKYKNIKFL